MTFLFNLAVGSVTALVVYMVLVGLARVVANALRWAWNVYDDDVLGYHITRVVGAVLSPVLTFVLAATITAAAYPPPRAVSYDTIAIKDEATWFERNAAWAAIKVKRHSVENRFFYSKAKVGEECLLGVPGSQKWYVVTKATYDSL